MATHSFILLLLAANSMALMNSYMGMMRLSSGRSRAIECTEPGLFCSSCQNSYFCSSAGATPLEIPCDAEQVCGGDAPASGCRDYVGTSAGDCDCDTIGNVGFLADPYDSTKYFMCIPPESQFLLECPAGEEFSMADNGCVEATITTTASDDSAVAQVDSSYDCITGDIGFHTNDPTCQTYTACYIANLPGLVLSCADGEAFDTSKFQCVPQCDLGPASFECAAGDSGAFPDTSDCTIFHVCSNGAAVTPSTGVPCPDGQVFEPTSMTCVTFSSDVVCPEINSCYAAYCDSCGGTCPVTLTVATQSVESTTPATTAAPSTTTPTTTTTPEITTTTTPEPTTTPKPATTPAAITTPEATTTPAATTTPEATTTPTTTSSTTTTTTTVSPTTTPEIPTAEATTTATADSGPPNCSNSPGYYEYASDCKQFWSCQSDDAGGYEPILYRCPGPLVYIPENNYCSFQSDLASAPGCITS